MNQINECLEIVHAFGYIQSKGGRLSAFNISCQNPAVPPHRPVTLSWNGSTNYLNNYGNWSQISLNFFFPKFNRILIWFNRRIENHRHECSTEIRLIPLMDALWTLQANKRLKMKKLTTQKCVSLNFTIWIPRYEKFLRPATIPPFQASTAPTAPPWLSLLNGW